MKYLNMKVRPSRTGGFTLIELLVVIAIIAILTGIIVGNFGPARGKARDAKRISDLGQIQLALSLYFDRCKQYPYPTGDVLVTTMFNGCPKDQSGNQITLGSFIAQIPTPPTSPLNQDHYNYLVNQAPGYPSDYVIHTALEYNNDVLKDGYQSNQQFSQSVNCTMTTSAPFDYCLTPR